jgi:hypothetical protein
MTISVSRSAEFSLPLVPDPFSNHASLIASFIVKKGMRDP